MKARRIVLQDWNDTANPTVATEGKGGAKHDHEFIMPFGMSYRPPSGLEGLSLDVGSADHDVIIAATGGQHRPNAPEGGVVLYCTNSGQTITLNPDGSTTIAVGGTTFKITQGRIETDMDIITSGDVVADGISLKEHIHGRVQSGGSRTGEPE